MNSIDEAQLAAYLDKWIERKYNRLLLNRFFQGIVTAIAGGYPPQVQIQRVGEANPDGNWYACPVPGYFPVVGDRVELVWRDDTTAHVFAPIGTQRGALVKIDERLLGAPAPSVVFPASGLLPTGFRHFKLISRALCDQGTVQDLNMQLSGNTGAIYNTQILGSGPGSAAPTASQVRTTSTSARIGICSVSSGTGNSYETTLVGVNGGAFAPQYISIGSRWDSNTGGFVEVYSGQMGVTGVVTSILLFPGAGLLAGPSLFTLYGLP